MPCVFMTQLRILFLGTSGSWPTIQRNVASTAIHRGSEVLLFDCGEGTQRQFQRTSLSYMQITNIFISHFHGDHFLGLPGLIQTMQLNDRTNPLHLWGPPGMDKLTAQLLSLGYFRPAYEIIPHEVDDSETIHFDGYDIRTLATKHNVPSLAYCLEENIRPGKFDKPKALALGIPEGPLFSRLQHGQTITLKNRTEITPAMVLGPPRIGRKVIITGDTTYDESLVQFAKDADVLIHEATFDSSFEDSTEYGHSTAAQAAMIAKQAGVDALFLTHISPRYLDPKVIEDDARTIFPRSFVARDFQEIEVRLKP